MLGHLEREGVVATVADGRAKTVRLTPTGAARQAAAQRRIAEVDGRWRRQMPEVAELRELLDELVGDGVLERSPLAMAIEPPPTGWRAQGRRPETLPHHPVVSHRGGVPDGS